MLPSKWESLHLMAMSVIRYLLNGLLVPFPWALHNESLLIQIESAFTEVSVHRS